MELSTKLYILSDEGEKFMGAGVLWLLEGIQETGSLLASSQKMGLSYTKARMMLDNIEKALGRSMIDRKKGGADHKGAELTPFAIEYIKLYKDFQDDVKAAAEDRFRKFAEDSNRLLEVVR